MLTLQYFTRRVTRKWLISVYFSGFLRIFGVVFRVRIPSSHKPMTQKISSEVQEIRSIDVSRKVDARKISETVQQLHTQFRIYGRNAREWMRKCVLMLPALERERVWEKKGFGSLTEYAGRLSGMSHKTVSDGLRILRAVEHMPDIMRVIEERGINCVKPIVTLLTLENQQFWAEKMRVMSQHALQMYRSEREHQNIIPPTISDSNTTASLAIFREGALSKTINKPHEEAIEKINNTENATTTDTARDSSRKKIIGIPLSESTLNRLTKLKGSDEWDTLMNELLDMREKILEQEKPEEKVTDSRHIPTGIQRFVIARSRGICEAGACAKKYEILHHTQRFASEQTHDPDRIIALCTSHERLVHLGLVEDEYIKPKEWKILPEPDKNDKKYAIDQLVQRYRRPG